MKYTTKLPIFSIVLLFSLISSLVFPNSVLADDTIPPTEVTTEVVPPTEEPVGTPQPPTVEITPTAPATEELPTEQPAILESATVPPISTELPVEQEPVVAAQEDLNIADIVASAVENNVILADGEGNPLSLTTVEATETIATGDPWFIRGGTTYRFMPIGGCTAYGGPGPTCFESTTPIQDALDNVRDNGLPTDSIVHVQPGTYEEQIVIETAGLTLLGEPGYEQVAGAALNAPILEGINLSGTTTGITILVEGVTVSGFIIQNYDTAIYQPVVVGSNAINILNNTIQENGNGIKVESDKGAPGTNINYNVFLNNTGFDLINNDSDDQNNQYTNAENNYWGCSIGPIVAYKKFVKQNGKDVFVGWRYRIWASPNTGGPAGDGEYVNNPNTDCALLYGSDDLWRFQINSQDYSPYKLIINSFETTFEGTESPALSLEKAAFPSTYDSVGDVISYSYLVTNTGNVTLDGPVTVSDNKTAVTCPAGGLTPTQSMTCSASYVITQADLDSGSVTNIAHASADGTDSNQDSATVTAVQSPALSIVKSASPSTYNAVGNVINYSYLVTNTGNVTLSGPFSVSDDLSTDESCPLTQSLAPGASITCTASYIITQADLNAGSVTNIAFAGNGTVSSPTDSETVTAVQDSTLAIVKTANPTAYSAVGQVISYSYLVTNNGNITLAGPFTVTDDKATVTCPSGDLAPGASLTCTASYTITQADLDSGSVTNIASASNGTVSSPTDSETVTAILAPALSIAKTASPITYDSVGDIISYSYLVTNTGNVSLSGPFSVTDDKAAVTCPTGGLAPGASLTCNATYVITQADLNAGSVTNIAFATNGIISSPTDTETVTAVQSLALSLVKTASPTIYDSVGDVINYSYVVSNTGNVTLTGPFTVFDDKTTVTCPPGDLAPGGSINCSASYAITQADLDAGIVTNVASATNGTVTSPTDTETVTAVQRPALAMDKSAAAATYSSVGNIISYSYLVTNTGNVTISGPITVTDDKATVMCPPGGLAPGASLTCTASYIITQADLDAGFVTNVAFATNGTVSSPADTVTVTAVQLPALTIVKTATPGTYDSVGDVISYSYLITNSGNIILAGPFTVTDDKATVTCPAGDLAPGASLTCSASYVITQADLNAGSVTNIASASNGRVTSPTDSETVTAIQNTGLTIAKTATPATYSAVGQVINYTYLVTNTGNITLTGPFTVTDDKATVTCPSGNLAPGASINCSASYSITQADIDAGSVTNIAFASNGTVTSPTDTETVTAVQGSALALVKLANPATYSAVGQVINYSYILTNTGNVTLTGPFTVTDDKATVTCPPGNLAPGASRTCTASYTITQADLDAGSVTNVASATNGTVTSLPDTETVNAIQNPALTVAKTASPSTYDSVGDVISYSYLVTNTGNITLSGPVTVFDDKATVTCPSGGLTPGASLTCNASYIITQADLDAGTVTNIARASANNTDSNEDSETVTAVQSSGLSLVKTASPAIYNSVGDIINYNYLVTNTGNVTLSGPISVFDDKATVICPAGDLASGASINCSASYVITQADLNAGSVTNIAQAYSSNETSSNEDSETVVAIQGPALTTMKIETSVGPYEVGATISYDIVVTNTGNVTLTGVTVTDDSAVLGTCVGPQPATLVPGASMTCSASHIVTNEDVDSGSYVNTASGDSDQTAPTTSSVTVNFTPDNPPTPDPQPTPIVVRPSVAFTGFIPLTGGETHAIAAGIAHTCAITPEGGVRCWGNNTYGQLGDGTNTASNVPVKVAGIAGGTTIVAGGNHTCVLTGNDVWCWGQNSQGQLGDGTTSNRNAPVKVLSGAVDITAGLDYTCAVMTYGQVMCWGNNDQGQLANGSKTDSTRPALAELITGISNVDAGQNSSCGITAGGLLRCVIRNSTDNLSAQSLDTTLDVAVNRFGSAVIALNGEGVPVIFKSGNQQTVDNVKNVWDIDGGSEHTCALLRDGTVKCWGSNTYGQLGQNSWISSSIPEKVLNVSSAWQLAVGQNHACVLIKSDSPSEKDIQCWGLNTDGQLGNGTNVNSAMPVFVK